MKLKLFAILIFIALLAAYIQFAPIPRYRAIDATIGQVHSPAQIAEGKKLAKLICIRCHYNEETNSLSGRQHGNPKRLGDFSSGNITQDSATGIDTWTGGQIYYFLKTGIKPDGDYVFDMPKYPNLSEEDLLGIVAFLQSDDSLVRKTVNKNPAPQFSWLTKLLHTVISPPRYDSLPVSSPDSSNDVALGKYLATAKYSCYECHSLNMVTTNYNEPEKSWRFLKGGNPHVNENREKIITPNITGDSVAGIGRWTELQFSRAVRDGIKPDSTTVRDPMFPFYLLTDREVKAMYRYLQSVR